MEKYICTCQLVCFFQYLVYFLDFQVSKKPPKKTQKKKPRLICFSDLQGKDKISGKMRKTWKSPHQYQEIHIKYLISIITICLLIKV